MSEKECLLCLRTPIEDFLIYSKKLYEDDLIASNVAKRAAKLIYSAYKKAPYEMCGARPKSLMASALYLSGIMEGHKRSQRIIAGVVGTTDITLRNLNKRFIKVLELELPDLRPPLPKHNLMDEDFIELYNQDLDDSQISERLGFSYGTIGSRRRKLGLPPISIKKFMDKDLTELHKLMDKDLTELHNQGLTDVQISEQLSFSYGAIRKRRRKLGLPPFLIKKFTDEEFLKYYNMGLLDAEIAKKLNVSNSSVCSRRAKLKLVANYYKKKMFGL